MLKLYNTLTKKKEEFVPLNPGKVSMYTCGPTVYDYVHIGNLKAYLMADVLRRYLSYSGLEVRHIKNITDVGHLTNDDIAQGDSGEDKMAKAARRDKKTPEEIAAFYEAYFKEKEKEFNILPAHYFPRATAHIPQMIRIIRKLLDNGHAYEKNGNVFFSIASFPDYGRLSGNTLSDLKIGARLEEHPDKRDPWDFALWLKAPKEHLLKWESPWSLGYPGWHIECSAMSTEYLGDTMDIHTGAEDNIFPHHEAEIAQTESATGKKFVNYWVHARHLKVDGVKMSKSKGNFYRLEDIREKGYDLMALRLLLLSAHYRKQMNFTWLAMDQAAANLSRIANFVRSLSKLSSASEDGDGGDSEEIDFAHIYLKRFEEAMEDDLNTPLALSIVFELITETNKLMSAGKIGSREAASILKAWNRINGVLGLRIDSSLSEIPEEIERIAEERKAAREAKDFGRSDELRDELDRAGYMIEDLPGNAYDLKRK